MELMEFVWGELVTRLTLTKKRIMHIDPDTVQVQVRRKHQTTKDQSEDSNRCVDHRNIFASVYRCEDVSITNMTELGVWTLYQRAFCSFFSGYEQPGIQGSDNQRHVGLAE